MFVVYVGVNLPTNMTKVKNLNAIDDKKLILLKKDR